MNKLDIDNWITNLNSNKNSCKLFGWNCVADFQINVDNINPIADQILDALAEPEMYHANGWCDDIDIGLYNHGKDIRVWKVWIT